MTQLHTNLVRGFISLLGGRIGRVLLGAALIPLLTRILASDGYGDYGTVMSLVAFAMILANGGVTTAVRKYISEQRTVSYWKSYVFSFYFRLSLITIFAITVIISFVYVSGVLRGSPFETYLLLILLIIATKQLFGLVRATLMGLNLEQYSEPISIGNKILFAAVGIPLAAVGLSVSGVLIGHIVGLLASTVVAAAVLNNQISYRRLLKPLPAVIPKREFLFFNFQNVFLLLFMASLYNTDILLVRALVGAEETGYYKAALVLTEMIWLIPSTVAILFVHNLSALWYEEKTEQINSLASQATKYTVLFTALLAIGLFVLADSFAPLYLGSDFTASVDPIRLLLPGVLCFGIAKPIYAICQAKGELNLILLLTGVAALVNVGLNLLLIPQYGMHGAAIGTSISYGSLLLFYVYAAHQAGFNPLVDIEPVKIGIILAALFVSIYTLHEIILSDWMSLLVVPAVGLLVFLSFCHILNVIDSSVVDRVKETVERI